MCFKLWFAGGGHFQSNWRLRAAIKQTKSVAKAKNNGKESASAEKVFVFYVFLACSLYRSVPVAIFKQTGVLKKGLNKKCMS